MLALIAVLLEGREFILAEQLLILGSSSSGEVSGRCILPNLLVCLALGANLVGGFVSTSTVDTLVGCYILVGAIRCDVWMSTNVAAGLEVAISSSVAEVQAPHALRYITV